MVTENAPRTARARVRAELTQEIKDVARRHLADTGSAGLSLRAVARELGMVSSAVYRYFPSRDELLTALIVDAYTAVGVAVTEAEARSRRSDLPGRWLAIGRGARNWAVEHPHEYALIFGSPVPGYAAPTDTIDPAATIPLLLLDLLTEAHHAGRHVPVVGPNLPRPVRADLKQLREQLGSPLTEAELARAVLAWAELIGLISFELFGHLHNVIHDYPAHFDLQWRRVGAELGLT